MTYTYKLIKDSNSIMRSDNTCICKDEANTDYQAYLEWAKTNTPEEAD